MVNAKGGFRYKVCDWRAAATKPALAPEQYITIPDEYRVFE
jgi:hypothetical protein